MTGLKDCENPFYATNPWPLYGLGTILYSYNVGFDSKEMFLMDGERLIKENRCSNIWNAVIMYILSLSTLKCIHVYRQTHPHRNNHKNNTKKYKELEAHWIQLHSRGQWLCMLIGVQWKVDLVTWKNTTFQSRRLFLNDAQDTLNWKHFMIT